MTDPLTTEQWGEWTALLAAYATGALDADGRRAVEAGLATSPALRAELAALRRVRDAVQAAGDEAPPVQGLQRMWSALDEEGPPPLPGVVPGRPSRRTSDTPGLRRQLVSLAAVAAIIAGLVVSIRVLQDPVDDGNATDLAPAELLTVSAEAMVEEKTARLEIDGRAEVTFDGSAIFQAGRVKVTVILGGDGAVRFAQGDEPDDFEFNIAAESVEGPVLARPDPAEIDSRVIDVDGVRYESEGGGPYEEQDPDADLSPFEQITVRPDLIGRLPELAEGDIEDVGTETLDGHTTRHLRFQFDPEVLTMDFVEGLATGEVWISTDDELVRQFRVRFAGPATDDSIPDAEWDTQFTFTLRDFGEPVTIEKPSVG